jgi:hypothetical protein
MYVHNSNVVKASSVVDCVIDYLCKEHSRAIKAHAHRTIAIHDSPLFHGLWRVSVVTCLSGLVLAFLPDFWKKPSRKKYHAARKYTMIKPSVVCSESINCSSSLHVNKETPSSRNSMLFANPRL